MIKTDNTITLFQYIFIVNGIQIGTGILSLPRIVAEKAGTDGWLAVIIGWGCSVLASIFLIQAIQNRQQNTTHHFFRQLFGKYIGCILMFFYSIYFLSTYWIIIVNSILFIQGWFLPHTSKYSIFLLLCIPTYMVAHKGIQSVGKYCEIIFYMTVSIPFLFLIFMPITNGHWLNFLPFLKEGMFPILKAVPSTAFSFLGFEMCVFLYPYLQQKKYALHGIIIANTITMIFYLFTVIICFYFFSPDGIPHLIQPVLSLLKLIEFRFLERFDLVILSCYLVVVSTSWISLLYGGILLINFSKKESVRAYQIIIILLISVLFIFLLNPSWSQLKQYQSTISNIGLGLVYCFSLFLWLYSKIYNRRISCLKK
ncbi:MAG: endospore germination permease [Bacillus sp. (in: firmicutes)]|uniref:GerAB/ArcD/ProY family transporter n=1 Tax=Bacillus sp. TaxID=1409 RepID=UPI0039E331D1